MCFEVSALVPAGASNGKKKGSDGNSASDDDINLMDSEGNDVKQSKCFLDFFFHHCISNHFLDFASRAIVSSISNENYLLM